MTDDTCVGHFCSRSPRTIPLLTSCYNGLSSGTVTRTIPDHRRKTMWKKSEGGGHENSFNNLKNTLTVQTDKNEQTRFENRTLFRLEHRRSMGHTGHNWKSMYDMKIHLWTKKWSERFRSFWWFPPVLRTLPKLCPVCAKIANDGTVTFFCLDTVWIFDFLWIYPLSLSLSHSVSHSLSLPPPPSSLFFFLSLFLFLSLSFLGPQLRKLVCRICFTHTHTHTHTQIGFERVRKESQGSRGRTGRGSPNSDVIRGEVTSGSHGRWTSCPQGSLGWWGLSFRLLSSSTQMLSVWTTSYWFLVKLYTIC